MAACVKKNALAHATLERIESTTARFQGFAEGYGTVLFFEDYEVIDSYQEKFPKLKDQFPIWSHQGAGMLQYVIWTALEHEDMVLAYNTITLNYRKNCVQLGI